MPGPAPKPTALKILEGNVGHRKLNTNEPKPPVKLPKAPAHLSPAARKIWKTIGPRFGALGIMSEVDEPAFVMLCESYAAYLFLIHAAREHGPIVKVNGQMVSNPFLSRADKVGEQCRKLLVEFGGSPSSRARLSVEGTSPVDELSEFLSEPTLKLAQ